MTSEPAAAAPLSTLPAERPEDARPVALIEVLRDITRGGFAGLLVGVVLGGLGGRLVMRLAAVLVPDANGAITENGNVIGRITFEGSLALVLFVGLFAGALAGSVWVVIRPWLPAGVVARGLVAAPIAIALGTRALVDDANLDFAVLAHDPIVIVTLVLLIAAFGPALAAVDQVLDRHLPHPVSHRGGAALAYWMVTSLGVVLTALLVVPTFLASDLTIAGIGLLVVGLATLASWWYRVSDRRLPAAVGIVAAIALVVATAAGLAVTLREVTGALG